MHPLVTQDHIDTFQRDGVVLIKGLFAGHVELTGNRLRITQSERLIARLVASEMDTFKMPQGRHSHAL